MPGKPRPKKKAPSPKAEKDIAHVSFKVYGEDADMARSIGKVASFSHICLHAMRAYHKLVEKFYGSRDPGEAKVDRLAPPPYEFMLIPIQPEKLKELEALSRKIEAQSGKPVSVEQLIARAVSAKSAEEVEHLPDPIPDLNGRLFKLPE